MNRAMIKTAQMGSRSARRADGFASGGMNLRRFGPAIELDGVTGFGEGISAGKSVDGDFFPVAADGVGDRRDVLGPQAEQGNVVGGQVNDVLELAVSVHAVGV